MDELKFVLPIAVCIAWGFWMYKTKGNVWHRILALGISLGAFLFYLNLTKQLSVHNVKLVFMVGISMLIGFLLGIIFTPQKQRPPR